MPRDRARFVCQECGAVTAKWSGRCDECGAWNSIEQEAASRARPHSHHNAAQLVPLAAQTAPLTRLPSGIGELDRVLGGGLVPASVILIGGDPGIGKSTITLQAAAALASQNETVIYVSGEESLDQIRLRAKRLGVEKADLALAASTSAEEVIAAAEASHPRLLIIDSIQTMYTSSLEQAPGTITQLRASAHMLVDYAKRRGVAVLLIGHVTKDGQIAGPRLLEHMVDTVLYFEGERSHSFRILRAVKNRFGPANEIGVFEMAEQGLQEVRNPSALFLPDDRPQAAGTSVFAGMEGSRPILVEIQALVGPAAAGSARRAVVGWDNNRLAMLLAVLETRLGLAASGRDVYLNVAGGLKVVEPAADLAVAAALISSLTNRAIRPGTVVFGEVGLAGEVRQVGHSDTRIKEAGKLGFDYAILPRAKKLQHGSLSVSQLENLAELVEILRE